MADEMNAQQEKAQSGNGLRLLHVGRSQGGTGSAGVAQIIGLARMGYEVHSVSCKLAKIDRLREAFPQVHLYECGSWGIWRFGRYVRRIYKELKPDIFYVCESWTIPSMVCSGIPLRRNSYVYHTVDYMEPGRYPVRRLLERWFARRARLVVCNEINRARFMCSEYGLGRMPVVVPVGLSEIYEPPLPDTTDESWQPARILYVGSLGKERLVPVIIRALKYLPETYTLDIYARVADASQLQECQKAAEEEGVEERVHFHDPVPNEDMVPMMTQYDVGVLIYDDSTMGNFYCQPQKLSEYVAAGMPIVAPNYPGMELLTMKHKIGATCIPTSPESVADAIKRVSPKNVEERCRQREELREAFRNAIAYEKGLTPLENALRQAYPVPARTLR